MARNFLGGLAWGGVTVVASVAVLSVVSPLAPRPEADTESPQATLALQNPVTQSGLDQSLPGDVATEQVPEQEPVTGTAPPVEPPQAADGTTSVADATEPTKPPVTGAAGELPVPQDTVETGALTVTTLDPVIPTPQAFAPMEPQDETPVTIVTVPASPLAVPAPEIVDDPGAELPVVGEPSGDMVEDIVVEEAPAQAPAEGPEETVPQIQARPLPVLKADVAPSGAATPQTDEGADTTGTDAPAAEAEQDASTEEPARVVARNGAGSTLRIGRPAGSLIGRSDATRSGRLPTLVGGETAKDADDSAGFDGRPVVQFARDFVNPDSKPLMAIVLMDEGQDLSGGSIGIAALRSFPYPVSFAVKANLPDAAKRMAAYRAEGFEVLAMLDLPVGAAAQDAEVTVAAALSGMPEVVGVLEGTGAGIQEKRALTDQVAKILLQTGHGLVVQSKGLNTAATLARKAGVPAAPVFRDIDSAGQKPTVIRRFLDQAAFKARQEGAIVMLGRVRPDTISALLVWGLADRAGTVALAPVSAVMTHKK